MNIREILEDTPIIVAVKDNNELSSALSSDSKIIFVLYGDILEIQSISRKIAERNKIGIVHIDLVGGLSSKDISVRFIKDRTSFHGIVSTKHHLIRTAKECGLFTVLRMFIFDSLSLENAKKHINSESDAIEILPGVIPKVIKSITSICEKPVIVGGLIENKSEVIGALESGATCVSTTNKNIWNI
jgi:glycerol uptake operon antiterminator